MCTNTISTMRRAIRISPALGRVITDAEGRYRFVTVKPGAYPWYNDWNSWRPAHIHFSLVGPAFANRLVTQMYFPGDPLFPLDAIANAVPKESRHLLVCTFRQGEQPSPSGRCPICLISCCAVAPPRRWCTEHGRSDALADHRTVPAFRVAVERRADLAAIPILVHAPDLVRAGP